MALISVSDLQKSIFDTIAHKAKTRSIQTVSLANALNRILAQKIIANINLPINTVSAMDGYALSDDGILSAGKSYTIIGESIAGKAFTGECRANECIRIMTGAIVPPSCHTVVMQENIALQDGCITLNQQEKTGSHIRHCGEEIAQGNTVLSSGRRISVADIMLLASLGIDTLSVYTQPTVLILSGGDELQEIGKPLQAGQIYDSNRPMLLAKLKDMPVNVIDAGCLKDNPQEIRTTLLQAVKRADVIITSGGVSVGDYDFLKEVLREIGIIHQYKVAMKPGKPFVFGEIHDTWYFGLPGNPVSGFVGFDVFIKQALWQLCGIDTLPEKLIFQAALSAPIHKKAGRLDMQRGYLSPHAQYGWQIQPIGAQDSHRVLGTALANAYIILEAESTDLPIGATVNVMPFLGQF